MKYKCIHCSNRCLTEGFYDGELHCSHVKCSSCGAKLILWYDKNEEKVVLVEDDSDYKE